MKKNIHPQYYPDAIIHCSCGKVFKMGATKSEMHVEVCSSCHPFYTGQDKMLDSAGRVEKFKKRLAAKKPASAKASAGKRK
ncbi:MAG TPA: 50S ribosomal protein L31 [Candidatus Paceibacterota bacterium]|nr:50S ribosomal protein L31 [Candidatus Paceibacterota bacterium]